MICLSSSAGEADVVGFRELELLSGDVPAIVPCSSTAASPLALLGGGGVCGLDPMTEDTSDAEAGRDGAGE